MSGGSQHKIKRVRPPRVNITYDVEIGGANKERELPFVMGVVADLRGGNKDKLKLKERTFVAIDSDNFNKVMAATNPSVTVDVPNRLRTDGGNLRLHLDFQDIDAFSPDRVARAVPELARLLEARARLNDLLVKLDGNDGLNDLLAEVVENTDVRVRAKQEIERGRQRRVATQPDESDDGPDKTT